MVDGVNVFWTGSEGVTKGGLVMRMPVNGGIRTTIASGQTYPVGIALDATNVYWTNYFDGTVMRTSKFGGRTQTLAVGNLDA
jgi:hypothetical protein